MYIVVVPEPDNELWGAPPADNEMNEPDGTLAVQLPTGTLLELAMVTGLSCAQTGGCGQEPQKKDSRDETESAAFGGATMLHDTTALNWPEESSASAVKPKVPAVVGVPEIEPLACSSTRPAGKLPVRIEYVNGGCPPLPISDELYVTPA